MSINIIDIIIVILLAFGGVLGFKRGAIRTGVSFIGLILAIILAGVLRHPLANFLQQNLPFFEFGKDYAGAAASNILLYEIIAFVVIFAILLIGVGFLSFVSSAIEKALDFTIVLGIPSKIAGIFIGILEVYLYVFIILYFLSLPMFNIKMVKESTFTDKILNNTPILTKTVGSTLNAFQEVHDLKDKVSTKEQYDINSMDILLKYKLTNVESVESLIKKGKIKINGIESVLDKYR